MCQPPQSVSCDFWPKLTPTAARPCENDPGFLQQQTFAAFVLLSVSPQTFTGAYVPLVAPWRLRKRFQVPILLDGSAKLCIVCMPCRLTAQAQSLFPSFSPSYSGDVARRRYQRPPNRGLPGATRTAAQAFRDGAGGGGAALERPRQVGDSPLAGRAQSRRPGDQLRGSHSGLGLQGRHSARLLAATLPSCEASTRGRCTDARVPGGHPTP